MKKSLFFVCPTDHIEPLINRAFEGENYFITSLGNNTVYDKNMTAYVKDLIIDREITDIVFLLSDQNKIFLDAVKSQEYSQIKGLTPFYNKIHKQEKKCEEKWSPSAIRQTILTRLLGMQMGRLKSKLVRYSLTELEFNAMLFDKENGQFRDIYPELISDDYVNMN